MTIKVTPRTETKILYGRKEAADQLSISLRTLSSYISKGLIKERRLGRRVLITRKELERFASEDQVQAG